MSFPASLIKSSITIGKNLAEKIETPQNKHFKNYLKTKHRCTFEFREIQSDELEKIIDSLKAKTSSGWDGISTKLLKSIKATLILPLTIIVNQMLKTGTFPDKLKIARIIPLYKKNDSSLFTNYRPISLLPAISKVFEKVIFLQLYDYFHVNKLFYNHQYGFREGHSTEFAAIEVIDRITQQMDNGETPFNVYLDLSKAFDTLDHNILMEKLKHYGVRNTLIENYLSNRQQYVEIEGKKSAMSTIMTGVPQGSILGPLLFIIYMNDISFASDLFNAIIYADDSTLNGTLSAFNTNGNNNVNINQELNKVSDWLKVNKLSLNVSKTKCMVFHTPQKQIANLSLEIDGVAIEQVSEFNFLGILISEHLNWKSHVEYIAGKLSRTNGILNKIKHYLPLHVKMALYNSLFVPHINYGILLWGNDSERIHKLQKRAIRIVTLNKYNSHTEPIFKELKLLKVMDIYKLNVLKFYHKYVNQKLPHYLQMLPLQPNNNIHSHYTRNHDNLHIRRVNHEFAKQCIRFNIPLLINCTQPTIKDKLHTHSLQGFSKYVKNIYINQYEAHCTIINCYVCNELNQ